MATETAIVGILEHLAGHFQVLNTDALAAIVKCHVDVVELAKRELASRGVDLKGKWIGFPAAEQFYRDLTVATPADED